MKNILMICLTVMVCINSSCSMFGAGDKKWKPVKPKASAYVHSVTWNDETLELISRWYTGKAENAEILIAANPTVNPEKLAAGTLVYIPRQLLQRQEMMPRSHVDDSFRKKTLAKTSPVKRERDKKSPGVSSEEFHLFGPR